MRDGTKTACIFWMFFKGQQRVVSDCQSARLPACPPVCLCCRLCLVSASIFTFSFKAVRSHNASQRSAAQRIASHCIESHPVTVQWFPHSLLSFVASVPGPVPVLILLCPVSTLSCLHHHHHNHYHHHINRSLVPPPRPRSTIHKPQRVART